MVQVLWSRASSRFVVSVIGLALLAIAQASISARGSRPLHPASLRAGPAALAACGQPRGGLRDLLPDGALRGGGEETRRRARLKLVIGMGVLCALAILGLSDAPPLLLVRSEAPFWKCRRDLPRASCTPERSRAFPSTFSRSSWRCRVSPPKGRAAAVLAILQPRLDPHRSSADRLLLDGAASCPIRRPTAPAAPENRRRAGGPLRAGRPPAARRPSVRRRPPPRPPPRHRRHRRHRASRGSEVLVGFRADAPPSPRSSASARRSATTATSSISATEIFTPDRASTTGWSRPTSPPRIASHVLAENEGERWTARPDRRGGEGRPLCDPGHPALRLRERRARPARGAPTASSPRSSSSPASPTSSAAAAAPARRARLRRRDDDPKGGAAGLRARRLPRAGEDRRPVRPRRDPRLPRRSRQCAGQVRPAASRLQRPGVSTTGLRRTGSRRATASASSPTIPPPRMVLRGTADRGRHTTSATRT